MKNYEGEKAVTKKMVSELIRCIKVSGYNKIEIIWNFQDEFDRIAQEIGKVGRENENRRKESRRGRKRTEKKGKDSTYGEVTE